MLQIIIHSSKTMRAPASTTTPLTKPQLLHKAQELVGLWRDVTNPHIVARMKVSPQKAEEVVALYKKWTADPRRQTAAIETFVGDIYSGLQAHQWSQRDRVYAQKHLLVLSGLYGGLRPYDGIVPYRLEMGYTLPTNKSLYDFWGAKIAGLLPASTSVIVNLSAVEYTKAVLPYANVPVINPQFLTVNEKTGKPTFVAVHTKIARGAFANWLIVNRIEDLTKIPHFAELGYVYAPDFSTLEQPVFVAKQFQGLGLSIRKMP